MRMLQLAAHREHVQRIEIHVTEEVANYLLNRKRKRDRQAGGERQHQVTDHRHAAACRRRRWSSSAYDNNNNEVPFYPMTPEPVGDDHGASQTVERKSGDFR